VQKERVSLHASERSAHSFAALLIAALRVRAQAAPWPSGPVTRAPQALRNQSTTRQSGPFLAQNSSAALVASSRAG
jgi:hypothetical protein